MNWFILAPLQLLCMLFCYITNPLVVLFADEEGELRGIFHLWQTWDDSLDVEWFVKERVPKIFRYDFDSKYLPCLTSTSATKSGTRVRHAVMLRPDAHFTIKERVQRYFCRVQWLYRNCGYGFAYYLLGKDIASSDIKWLKKDDKNRIGYSLKHGLFNAPWVIWSDDLLFSIGNYNIFNKIYLGWKVNASDKKLMRCMIATRISFKIEKKNR